MPWLRCLVACLSARRPVSIPGQLMWDLSWTKWHYERFFSQYFSAFLSVSFHHCSIFIFVFALFFSEGRRGEAEKPSKKPCSFGIWSTGWHFFVVCEGVKHGTVFMLLLSHFTAHFAVLPPLVYLYNNPFCLQHFSWFLVFASCDSLSLFARNFFWTFPSRLLLVSITLHVCIFVHVDCCTVRTHFL